MGKKEGCNKMNKKVHFVTAPFFLLLVFFFILAYNNVNYRHIMFL